MRVVCLFFFVCLFFSAVCVLQNLNFPTAKIEIIFFFSSLIVNIIIIMIAGVLFFFSSQIFTASVDLVTGYTIYGWDCSLLLYRLFRSSSFTGT